MPSLKDIKRKIKSVQNTQKTTRAMKLVSTSKLRKAELAAKRSREYAAKINEVLSEICYKIDKYHQGGIDSRYFYQTHESERETLKMVDIVFVTADKGLCGGFNMATIKEVRRLMEVFKSRGVKVRLRGVGKKGIDFFTFNEIELVDSVRDLSSQPNYARAAEFIKKATHDFANGITDKVIVVHNGYKNMITQQLHTNDLLPIDTSLVRGEIEYSLSMMEIEPDDNDQVVLEQLAEKYIEYSMFFALLDSLAAEHSARMQAMDAATNNAREMVKSLTLQYNKARQQAITNELIEINTGMEAMK